MQAYTQSRRFQYTKLNSRWPIGLQVHLVSPRLTEIRWFTEDRSSRSWWSGWTRKKWHRLRRRWPAVYLAGASEPLPSSYWLYHTVFERDLSYRFRELEYSTRFICCQLHHTPISTTSSSKTWFQWASNKALLTAALFVPYSSVVIEKCDCMDIITSTRSPEQLSLNLCENVCNVFHKPISIPKLDCLTWHERVIFISIWTISP